MRLFYLLLQRFQELDLCRAEDDGSIDAVRKLLSDASVSPDTADEVLFF